MSKQVISVLTWSAWQNALLAETGQVCLPHWNFNEFREPWEGQRNAYPSNLLVCVERGALLAELAEQTIELGANMFLWLPPDCMKRFSTRGTTVASRLHLSLVQDGRNCSPLAIPTVRQCGSRAASLFRQLRELQGREKDSPVLRAILVLLSEVFRQGEEPGQTQTFSFSQRERIEDILRSKLSGAVSAVEMAQAVGLTTDYFRKVFARTYQTSPRSFIKQARLAEARRLMEETSLSLKEISLQSGFQDTAFFCREFRLRYHSTPGAYRKASRL